MHAGARHGATPLPLDHRAKRDFRLALRSIAFLAVILTGLALIAPAAHLFELPGKIHMTGSEYFTVQRIYRGWWIVGLLLPAALLANIGLALIARNDRLSFWLALIVAALIATNLFIFLWWTQPANAATDNWTIQPENWRALRQQWEYSHAVNAGVNFIAFCISTTAALRARAYGATSMPRG